MAIRLERQEEVKTLKEEKSLQDAAAQWVFRVKEKEIGAVKHLTFPVIQEPGHGLAGPLLQVLAQDEIKGTDCSYLKACQN